MVEVVAGCGGDSSGVGSGGDDNSGGMVEVEAAMSQLTLWREGDAGLMDASSKGRKYAESPPMFI